MNIGYMDSYDELERSIETGKVRGYSMDESVGTAVFYKQYAIKKERGVYLSYYFCIDHEKMDVIEDENQEEILQFPSFSEAINQLELNGAEVERFGPIKGCLPF